MSIDSSKTNSIDANLAIIYGCSAETVTLIKIDADWDVTKSVVCIEPVVKYFCESVTLYDSGDMYVLLDTDTDFQWRINNLYSDKQFTISNIEDLSNTYSSFLAFYNQNGQIRILPKNPLFSFAFKHVQKIVQKISADNTVHVSLKNIEMNLTKKAYARRDVSLAHYKANVKAAIKKVLKSNILPSDICNVIPLDQTDFMNLPVAQATDDVSNSLREQQLKVQEEQTAQNVEQQEEYNIRQQFVSQPTERFGTYGNESVQQDNISYAFSSNYPETQRQFQISAHNRLSTDQEANRFGLQTELTPQTALVTSRSELLSHGRATNDLLIAPTLPPRYSDYVDPDVRLASFVNWNLRSPEPRQLATAGFFFTKQADLVRCFQCGIGLKDFSEVDDPLLEHVRHSGQCHFLPKLLGQERLNYLKAQLEATDPDYNRQAQWNGGRGNFPARIYRHPEYRTFDSRLATFTRWPPNMTQTPAQLAEAGLYYTGEEDLVRCFACDGGLRRWDPADDPWTEHCRWFPTCPFCIEHKGEEYIALVQASVDQQELSASNDGMLNDMEHLRITETEVQSLYNAHKVLFSDMGFKQTEVKEAIKELRNRGNKTPEIEDIVDLIAVIKERNELEKALKERDRIETPSEENRRLKRMLTCNICHENSVNALLLPCTHHMWCIGCVEHLSACPRCNRPIRDKIKTFMG